MEIEKKEIDVGMVIRLGTTTSTSIGLQERIVKVLAVDGEDFLLVEGITDPEFIRCRWEIKRSQWTFFSVDESYLQIVSKDTWLEFLPDE